MSINTNPSPPAISEEHLENHRKWLNFRTQAKTSGFFGSITESYSHPIGENTGLIPVQFNFLGGDICAEMWSNRLEGGIRPTYVLSREVWASECGTPFPKHSILTKEQALDIIEKCLVEKTRLIRCCGFSEIYGTGKFSIYCGRAEDGQLARQFKVGLFLAACASSITTDFLGSAAGLQLIFSTEHYDLVPMTLIINKLQALITRYGLGTSVHLPNLFNPNSHETLGTLIWSPNRHECVSASTWAEIQQEIVVWE